MPVRFPGLAVEIIELLTCTLEPTDVLSVRLVCRELYRKTLQHFSRTFFTTVSTDLTPQSLQRLQNVSNSTHLAHSVKLLHIIHDRGNLGQGFQWHRHSSGHLIAPLPGVDLLQDILVHNLLNCRSFHIDGYDEVQQDASTDSIIPGDAIGIIFSIVAETGLTIQSFTVDTSPRNNLTEGRLDTERLRVPLCSHENFLAGWKELKELVLKCKITSDQHGWLFDIISHAPRLCKLSFAFAFEVGNHIDLFMRRLVSTRSCSKLEELNLRTAHMTAESFCQFILLNSATIRLLSLYFVTLDDGGSWSSVLNSLSGNLPYLESFYIFFLRQSMPGRTPFIRFDKLTEIPVVPGSEVLLSGSLKHDSRLLPVLERPMELTYKFGLRSVAAVKYLGPRMDVFLHVLAEAAELC